MAEVHLTIDGRDVSAEDGMTILEAARSIGVTIPTLCFLKDCNEIGACRVCIVAVKNALSGKTSLTPACITKVKEGMEVETSSAEVMDHRRTTVDLICSNHNMNCEYCPRYTDCELHRLVRVYGLDDRKYLRMWKAMEEDGSAPHLVREYSRCVLCRRCVSVCKMQTTNILGIYGRGKQERIGPIEHLANTKCIGCGQCVAHCPTGALHEKDETQKIWNALRDGKVVAFLSQDVGERFGEMIPGGAGVNASRRIAAFLRKIGFSAVYPAPPITVCPAVRRYGELHENAGLPSFAPEQKLLQDADAFVVDIEPCIAYKMYPGERADVVISARELYAFFLRACVSRFTFCDLWEHIEEEELDAPPYAADGSQRRAITGMANVLEAVKTGGDCDDSLLLACPGGCLYGGGQPRANISEHIRGRQADCCASTYPEA